MALAPQGYYRVKWSCREQGLKTQLAKLRDAGFSCLLTLGMSLTSLGFGFLICKRRIVALPPHRIVTQESNELTHVCA